MGARPRIWQANLLVFLILIVVAVLGSVAQVISTSWGLLFTEFVLILLPTLAFVAWGTWRGWFRPRQVLNLRRIDRAGVGLSLLLGFAGWPVAVFIATIAEKALSLVGSLDMMIPPPRDWLDAGVYAIAFIGAAALCEELLFRGVVLRAYGGQGALLAVVYTAVLFGLFHASLSALPAATFLGLVQGYVATRCQSVYASMLAHAANNTLATTIIVFREPLLPLLDVAQWVLAPVGAAALVLGWFLLRRHTEIPPEPVESGRPAWRDWTFWVTLLLILLVFALVGILELVARAGAFGALG